MGRRARGSGLELHVRNTKAWQKLLEGVEMTDSLKEEINEEYGAFISEFVPEGDTGNLRYEWNATPEGVRYPFPYAHYMYGGVVWGPNYLVGSHKVLGTELGEPVYRTPKGVRKFKTDREIEYTDGFAHWDRVAMADGGAKEFGEIVGDIIADNIKRNLNG